jgi:hypothetical protein
VYLDRRPRDGIERPSELHTLTRIRVADSEVAHRFHIVDDEVLAFFRSLFVVQQLDGFGPTVVDLSCAIDHPFCHDRRTGGAEPVEAQVR